MPKATRVKRRQKRTRKQRRRKQRGGELPDKYPGLLVTARGRDIEDPPVVMSQKAYMETTDAEGESSL
jgi:hypothetical protein